MDVAEKERIANKTQQILRALRSAGKHGLTNVQLSRIALRYGGNLGELYRDGYEISKVSLGNGVYLYTLIEEPEVPVKREKAIDKLVFEVQKAGTVDWKQLIDLLDENNIGVKYKANTYKK